MISLYLSWNFPSATVHCSWFFCRESEGRGFYSFTWHRLRVSGEVTASLKCCPPWTTRRLAKSLSLLWPFIMLESLLHYTIIFTLFSEVDLRSRKIGSVYSPRLSTSVESVLIRSFLSLRRRQGNDTGHLSLCTLSTFRNWQKALIENFLNAIPALYRFSSFLTETCIAFAF